MFDRIRDGCRASAEIVVPYVYDLVRPTHVVDVGGGEGWWAREFARLGNCQCVVYDESVGSPGARRLGESEEIGAGRIRFEYANFETDECPISDERYDLAICLEVAEHVAPEWADRFIRDLCALAPIVLFSAAIPHQGGHGHVNEQWPAYWAERFHAHNFVATDIRDRFWDDERVEPWYRQNLLIFGSLDHDWMGTGATHGLSVLTTTTRPRALVHPDIYGWRVEERDSAKAAN